MIRATHPPCRGQTPGEMIAQPRIVSALEPQPRGPFWNLNQIDLGAGAAKRTQDLFGPRSDQEELLSFG